MVTPSVGGISIDPPGGSSGGGSGWVLGVATLLGLLVLAPMTLVASRRWLGRANATVERN